VTQVSASHSSLRIFLFSAVASVLIFIGVGLGLGLQALVLTLILTAIEITFSFDNAIINAKLLGKLAPFWRTIFLTVGIVIAIFGMRVLFPVLIVMLTAHLGWHEVVNLALHHPKEYAHHLEQAHTAISAFGGAFLLLLALDFFMEDEREVYWIQRLERLLSRFSHWLIAPVIVAAAVIGLAVLPANDRGSTTLLAGLLGAATFIGLKGIDALFAKLQGTRAKGANQTGLAALSTLLYLEVLDASFSFDGVIGAFAITSDVILIAAGLGIGALWVRSLTVYMVRKQALTKYIYIEHGAHYTVLMLAIILLLSILHEVSDLVPGLAGLAIIGASVIASVQARRGRVKT